MIKLHIFDFDNDHFSCCGFISESLLILLLHISD